MTGKPTTNHPTPTSPHGAFSFFKRPPAVGDFVGAISVALVLIPQSIAYAAIAGLPPRSGLLAATLPLIVAAPFVSCPWLQTGPTALTSLLALGALATIPVDDFAEYIKLASMLAVIVGITRFLLGVFKLGRFLDLLKAPMVLGFTTAAAVLIIAAQMNHALGEANQASNVLVRAFRSLINPAGWSAQAILMTILCGAIMMFGEKIHRLFPSVLVAAVIAILISVATNYQAPVVGPIPGGFLSISVDFPWQHLINLIFPGVVIALVGFAEPASISITLTREAGIQWNASRELMGGGIANLTSALVGGYPIGGSFSRTSVNRLAGATTSWSGLITGVIVISFLPFTSVLQQLPKAALAAIIMMAVIRLIKIREMSILFRSDRRWGYVAIVTAVATLITAPRVEFGVIIGVIFSVIVSRYDNGGMPNDDTADLSV